ncbi:DEAD/DEAH box helicase [Lapillicoccus sp.]|uniref:DEAD/DEAH box helicase n=1 Tax=Lapillicoccus sp. TaxID=1909287 RepID=UPI003264AD80
MPNTTASGAPKKARWTAAQKAQKAAKPSKKAHRGQEPRAQRPFDSTRPPRNARPAGYAAAPSRGREDRPVRDDRAPRTDRFERSERPERREWTPRNDRPVRDDRAPRSDRGDRPERREWTPRNDRPVRDDRAPRSDRPERREWTPRGDRADRPVAGRDHREHADRSHAYRGSSRDERPARGGFGIDPEAERLEADTWTTSARKSVSDGPVVVDADNGFTALGLPARLVERLARDGITTPFPIQSATIPDALAGRDVLGRGQTGSGKTLAFGLPTLARLADEAPTSAPRRPRALVLVPTRELAMQVSDALEPLVHVMGLKHKLVAGGLSYTTQIAALNRGVDLLIATPGRLNDLIERGAVELRDIRVAILDEADHMAEMGFLPEISAILDGLPAGGQRLLFSATLDRGVDGLVASYLTDAVTHSTDDAKASVTTMAHHVLLVEPNHKKVITAEVANRPGRTLVFVRTKLGADRIALQLREQGVLAAALHGGLAQGARNRVLGAFRDGTLPVLVATDVAARGIHVDDVSVVMQVDPPADHKDYLHRAGRTARAGEDGTVVTLALPHQRKTMERQLREAGVDAVPTRAVPGDAVIEAAGGRTPSGVPVPEDTFRRLLEGPKSHRGPGGSRGPRGGARGGFRPHHGGSDRSDRAGRSDRSDRGERSARTPRIERWERTDR